MPSQIAEIVYVAFGTNISVPVVLAGSSGVPCASCLSSVPVT